MAHRTPLDVKTVSGNAQSSVADGQSPVGATHADFSQLDGQIEGVVSVNMRIGNNNNRPRPIEVTRSPFQEMHFCRQRGGTYDLEKLVCTEARQQPPRNNQAASPGGTGRPVHVPPGETVSPPRTPPGVPAGQRGHSQAAGGGTAGANIGGVVSGTASR